MGVDPGTLTITAAVLDLQGGQPLLLSVLVIRPAEGKTKMRDRVTSLSMRATLLGAGVKHFGVKHAVVEGQHYFDSEKDANDILLLSANAGSCLTGIATSGLEPRFLEPGEWSKMDKKTRANRIRDIYLPGQVSRPQIQKLLTTKIDAREYGDVLDAIGMAYWALKGFPRGGV